MEAELPAGQEWGPEEEYFTLPHTIRVDPSKFGCIPSGIW